MADAAAASGRPDGSSLPLKNNFTLKLTKGIRDQLTHTSAYADRKRVPCQLLYQAKDTDGSIKRARDGAAGDYFYIARLEGGESVVAIGSDLIPPQP